LGKATLYTRLETSEACLLHQRSKDICYLAIAKATFPNHWARRCIDSVSLKREARNLHLGCGKRYLPGFVNIDANPFHKIDIWLDVRRGLPFATGSVDSIYTTHVAEHFYPDELNRLLDECARVLKPGAGLRLIVPSLHSAILAYQQQRSDWFEDRFPRHFDSLGGRFSNFLFCDGQHRTAFDFSYFAEILHKAGFREVEQSAEGTSRLYAERVPPFQPEDDRVLPHSLYVEAFR